MHSIGVQWSSNCKIRATPRNVSHVAEKRQALASFRCEIFQDGHADEIFEQESGNLRSDVLPEEERGQSVHLAKPIAFLTRTLQQLLIRQQRYFSPFWFALDSLLACTSIAW